MSKNTFSGRYLDVYGSVLKKKHTQHRSLIPFQNMSFPLSNTHTHTDVTCCRKKKQLQLPNSLQTQNKNKFGHLRVFTPRNFWGFQPVSTPFLAVQKIPVFPQRAVLPGETKPLKVLPWPSWGEFIDGLRIGFSPWKSTIVRLPFCIDFQTV